MNKFLEFRKFVESKPNSRFSQSIVLAIVNEVIRLLIEHEGLIDPSNNLQTISLQKEDGQEKSLNSHNM